MTSKQGLIMGLGWGIAIVSFIGFIVFLSGGSVPGERIEKNVNQNANINSNTNDAQIPPEPVADVTKLSPVTNSDHILGDKNAKVTLIEFSDFQCSFCARHNPTLDKILSDYQGKVRLVFRHFPLTNIHPYAAKAAEASECANDQGKFWEMHDKLFANQDKLTVADLKQYAKDLGLNQSKFDGCLDSGKYTDQINKQSAEAQAAGITGTPGTFVGSELVKGAYPYETFKTLIDAQLAE